MNYAQSWRTEQRKKREEAAIRGMYWLLTALAIAILIFVMIRPAYAEDSIDLDALVAVRELDKNQKIILLTALALTDYQQTVHLVIDQPNAYREENPIMGSHPTREKLALFGAAGIAATWLVGKIDHPIANILVDSIVATEMMVVWSNEYICRPGVHINVPVMAVVKLNF